MDFLNTGIEKAEYSVKSLLTAHSELIKGLSDNTIEDIEAQALESMNRAGIELINSWMDFKKISLIAKLTQEYPPEGTKAYINANECLNYVIEDRKQHVSQMEAICEALNVIQSMTKEITEIVEEVRP